MKNRADQMAPTLNLYFELCGLLRDGLSDQSSHLYNPDDWQRLIELAARERVVSILYHKILEQEALLPSMPQSALEILRQRHHQYSIQQVKLLREAAIILDALQQAGIPVIVLKGLFLAYTLYPHPSLRPIGDIDLMIHYEEVKNACRLVEELGYQPEFSWRDPEIRANLRRNFFIEANFDKSAPTHSHVELHWRLVAGAAYKHSADPQWFWQGVEPFDLDGRWVLGLTAERNLLYLAGHAALKHTLFKHGAARPFLLWYYDIHLLLQRTANQLNWETVLEASHRFNWYDALCYALAETQARFGTPLPEDIQRAIVQARNANVFHPFEQAAAKYRSRSSDTLDDFRRLRPRWQLWLLTALIFPSKAFMLHRYPIKSKFLWQRLYLYRWFDALKDIIKTIYKYLVASAAQNKLMHSSV